MWYTLPSEKWSVGGSSLRRGLCVDEWPFGAPGLVLNAFNVLILLIRKISHATGGWWMASSLLGLFFKVELNQIRESEPTWTFVDVPWSHQRGVCQSQSQASGLCDSQWRRFEERWQAPVDWNESYKVDFHNLTQIFTDLYRAFRAATADQRYLKASTAQHYQKIIKDLMRKLAGYMTHSQSYFLLDSFVRISAINSAPNAQAHGVLNRPANSSIEAPEDSTSFCDGFQSISFKAFCDDFRSFIFTWGRFPIWLNSSKWFELKPLSDGPRFRPFCRFEFLICPSFQEIEPYATRCGENPLDWSTNKHQHLHWFLVCFNTHSLHWIKSDISLSLSPFLLLNQEMHWGHLPTFKGAFLLVHPGIRGGRVVGPRTRK